jgi:glycosyltransferase involved in cell wall biosynthesis
LVCSLGQASEMVIAHVIDSLEVGGAEMVVATLSRIQVTAGHVVEVHCLIKAGALAGELEADGIRVVVHGAVKSAALAWSVFRAFRRSRPEVVHCHNKMATVHAAAVARLTGARVVSTRHGMAAPPYRLRKELKFWVNAAVFCDRVVAVCEVARLNMIAGAGAVAHNVVTIRNGAYPSHASGNSNLSKRGFTLVSVGRLVAAKNYETLLRAVAAARGRVPDLALWIVGDGDDAASLKSLAADLGLASDVRFVGARGDVGHWLRAAHVFVLSSVSEGLPISVLEAMAAGLPAILTDVGGMPEVVELSGAGRTVPPRDVQKLAAAIVELSERRHELEELGRRAASCYRRYFTPERMAGEYLALYQRCLLRRAEG